MMVSGHSGDQNPQPKGLHLCVDSTRQERFVKLRSWTGAVSPIIVLAAE